MAKPAVTLRVAVKILRYHCEILSPLQVLIGISEERGDPVWNEFAETYDSATSALAKRGFETVSAVRVSDDEIVWDTRSGHAVKLDPRGYVLERYISRETKEDGGRTVVRIEEASKEGRDEGDVVFIARGKNFDEVYREIAENNFLLIRKREVQGKYHVWYAYRPKHP